MCIRDRWINSEYENHSSVTTDFKLNPTLSVCAYSGLSGMSDDDYDRLTSYCMTRRDNLLIINYYSYIQPVLQLTRLLLSETLAIYVDRGWDALVSDRHPSFCHEFYFGNRAIAV